MTGLRVRPTADTFPLDELVGWARAGSIRVPSFQRGLRWTRRDVVSLFDSIFNGYPIGGLLLWERAGIAETVTLGPLRIQAPAGSALWVVGDQQRITALAAALVEEGHQDPRFAIGYDLGNGGIRGSSHAGPGDVGSRVRALRRSALLKWFHDRPELMDRFDDAAGFGRLIRFW